MKANNLLRIKGVRHTLLSFASGVLLSLSYTVSSLWFLSFVALVPLLVVLRNTEQKRVRFLWAFLAGTIYFGSVFSFLFSAHPITWSGIDNPALSVAFISGIWISTAVLFSLFTGIWGVLARQMSKNTSSVITLASLWVLFEWIQALSLSLLWWETQGLVGPHWTFGFIGYTLAGFPLLLSLASLGGVYLLSFVVVGINGLIFRTIVLQHTQKHSYRKLLLTCLFLALLSVTLYTINARARDNAEVIQVASLYTNFGPLFFTTPESESTKNLQIAGLFDTILFEGKNPHLILLPENSEYLASLTAEKRKDLVRRMSKKEKVVIVDSYYSYDSEQNRKVAVLEYETGNNEIQSYTKQLLVPTAEYLPRIILLLGNLFLEKDWNVYFENYLSIEKGGETTVGMHENLRIGALFCSEVLTPTLYKESTQRGANLLVNTASHSILNSSEQIYNQILKFSKVRAVENNRFFVQSGNSVPSFAIDNHGRMLGETGRSKNSILYTDVLLLENKTVATRTGGLWIMMFALLSIGGFIRRAVTGRI